MTDKVTHFEIPADDVTRAQNFYKNIFGWEMNEIPEMNYTMVNTVAVDENQMPKEPGAINGGITKRNAPGETPVIVIRVSKIDDAVRNVETGGGKVVMPTTKVGDRGLYAKVTDTEGNVIGIWQGLMG